MPNVREYSKESVYRSLLKSFSWRIIAISDTILIVFLVTCIMGDCGVKNAIAIGALEFLIKIFGLHSRKIWLSFSLKNVLV